MIFRMDSIGYFRVFRVFPRKYPFSRVYGNFRENTRNTRKYPPDGLEFVSQFQSVILGSIHGADVRKPSFFQFTTYPNLAEGMV